jgi:hypothetical protein
VPFDDQALAPLSVTLLTAAVDRGQAAVVERRRYEARAFVAGTIELPRIELRAGQPEPGVLLASSMPPPLLVRSSLPDPPGGVEWPGDVRELPQCATAAWWIVPAALALLLGASWWVRPRRRPAAVAAAPPPAHERTLAALAALRSRAGTAGAALFHEELSAVVRDHCAHRWGLAAAARTSEELVRAVPVGAVDLRACLSACDFVKFAAAVPPPGGAAAAVEAALAFVRATAPRDAAA